jgi:hypothetical protein
MSLFSFKPLAIHDRIGGTSSDVFKAVVITEAVRSAPQRLPAKPASALAVSSAAPATTPSPTYKKISSVLAPVVVISAIGLVVAVIVSSARPST